MYFFGIVHVYLEYASAYNCERGWQQVTIDQESGPQCVSYSCYPVKADEAILAANIHNAQLIDLTNTQIKNGMFIFCHFVTMYI